MEKMSILGVKISNLSLDKILERIEEFLAGAGQHFIVTPNPEIILSANKDEELFYILNCADLSLGDGIGLKFAAWFSGLNLRRITGADFTDDLLNLAAAKNIKAGIFINEKGLSKKNEVERALREKYPALNFLVLSANREADYFPDKEILDFQPKILLIGFGAPWQEKFIFHNLAKIPSVRIAMGVGGVFDFLTGRRRRAPKFLRSIGLEWLWRFLFSRQETGMTKRSRRIWNATVVFPFVFLINKYLHPFFYRPCVVCLLYKKVGDKYKILLVERKEERNHWQLPQGGTDGESLLVAGERELSEEINTHKFIAKRVYKKIYRYKFGGRPGETSIWANSRRKHTGYRGQKQGLFIAEFTGRDQDIKVNFWDHTNWKWVDSEKLVDEVHLIRKRGAQRFLGKFREFTKQK